MTRVLLKVHHPVETPAGPDETLDRNRIGNNVGNYVFAFAAQRHLTTPTTELVTEPTGPWFAHPERVNAEVDHVVMPLANHFRASNLGALARQATALEQLTVPVTVLGVGGQADLAGDRPRDEQQAVDDHTRRFVRAVLERGPSIGVRGEYTKSYLVDLGFDEARVDVIGCPSLFLHGPSLPLRLPDHVDATDPLAINVSPYVREMGPVLLHNLRRSPHLAYLAQDVHTLRLLLRGTPIAGPVDDPTLPLHPDHPAFATGRTIAPLNVPTWLDELAGRRFSFGTRIHGNIVALLAGTPAVVLAHDSRTLELARYHHIPHRSISELTPHEATPERLYADADFAPLVDGHADRFAHYLRFLEAHGLPHAFTDGADVHAPTAFDRLITTMRENDAFPSPVVSTGPASAPGRLRRALARRRRAVSSRPR